MYTMYLNKGFFFFLFFLFRPFQTWVGTKSVSLIPRLHTHFSPLPVILTVYWTLDWSRYQIATQLLVLYGIPGAEWILTTLLQKYFGSLIFEDHCLEKASSAHCLDIQAW